MGLFVPGSGFVLVPLDPDSLALVVDLGHVVVVFVIVSDLQGLNLQAAVVFLLVGIIQPFVVVLNHMENFKIEF